MSTRFGGQGRAMRRSRKEQLLLQAEEWRRACAARLKTLMIPGVPKLATKDALFI